MRSGLRSGARLGRFSAAFALAGLVFAGLTTSAAAAGPAAVPGEGPQTCAAAQSWVASNQDRLPRTYDGVVAHSLPYRKAIFAALGPQEQGRLWVEQLQRYRNAHPDLTPAQSRVLDQGVAIFAGGLAPERDLKTEVLPRLKRDAVAAFGKPEAAALLTRLGPAQPAAAVQPAAAAGPAAQPSGPAQPGVAAQQADCECATLDPWCGDQGCVGTIPPNCNVSGGCGTAWVYDCDGQCA